MSTQLHLWISLALSISLGCASMHGQQKSATPDKADSMATDSDVGKDAASAEALQKATQNPVANLISVPIQNNSNFGIGPYNRTQDVLNIQPVIPAHISKNWMLISRIIQPIVWQPYLERREARSFVSALEQLLIGRALPRTPASSSI